MSTFKTPRLCIDARVPTVKRPDKKSAGQLMVTQEFLQQLLGDEPLPPETVLLTYPDQKLDPNVNRYNTRRKVGGTPLYWWWERHFINTSKVGAFHRFRPADRLNPQLPCPTLTTVLPSNSGGVSSVQAKPNHHFAVPSKADAKRLEKQAKIHASLIHVVTPSVRDFLVNQSARQVASEGFALFLLGETREGLDFKKFEQIVATRFPNLPRKIIPLKRVWEFSPESWSQLLEKTQICFYLTQRAFDWPTLALETLYCRIPTIYPDEHNTLSEILPANDLKLSRFLVNQPDPAALSRCVEKSREDLSEIGAFSPKHLVNGFREIYGKLEL